MCPPPMRASPSRVRHSVRSNVTRTSAFGVNLFPVDDDVHILIIIIAVINVRKFTSLSLLLSLSVSLSLQRRRGPDGAFVKTF